MAGTWIRVGTVSVTQGSKKVTGSGTTWASVASNKPAKGHTFWGPDGKAYELDYVESDTVLYLVDSYIGASATGQAYRIDNTRDGTVPALSRKVSEFYAYQQGYIDALGLIVNGTGDVTFTAPDGQSVTVPALANMLSKSGNLAELGNKATARRNLGISVFADTLLDDANASTMRSTLGLGDTESGSGALMRVGGPAILDAERYALERASGGRQTIIRDAAGAANVMFVLPRFTYADLGMSADMGSGDVTAFDFGSGSIKSEIFIGAYLASGSGAVSAPMQDPIGSVTHTAARDACTAKGAGWHLMTAHEDAAIALWCMANGYEPIGNTSWGRSHAKTWLIGDRADGKAPGDASGTGRTQTGSMGPEANHDKSTHGIADLVGNVWEWRDGFLLQDGRFKISAHNTQAETGWSFIDAYLDASTTTGGAPILSNQIINRLGTIGDNANAGNYANSDWRAMTKSSGYVSNQLLRRLLLEPSLTLPQGRIYMRNFGERLPYRGGRWNDGADAGLAAVALSASRVSTNTNLGFRPAFAS